MLCRLLRLRAFKPYAKYQAEKLGLTVEEIAEMRRQKTAGAYNDWRDRTVTEGRINFILDHVPSAEQAGFLKEFSTTELANYILDNIRNIDEASLKKLCDLEVTYNALPIVNGVMDIYNGMEKEYLKKDANVAPKNRLANEAKWNLSAKLKELAWKQADAEVAQSPLTKA